MFNFLRNHEQETKLKALQAALPSHSMHEEIELKLSRISITYDIDQTKRFRAIISYAERPELWNDKGATKDLEIYADSWWGLIDKIIEHFKEAQEDESIPT